MAQIKENARYGLEKKTVSNQLNEPVVLKAHAILYHLTENVSRWKNGRRLKISLS